LIDSLNKIEGRFLFFAMVVLVLCFDMFSSSAGMTDLAKMLVSAYAGYMTGQQAAAAGGMIPAQNPKGV
jgi:hypothetical protein